MEGLKFSAVYRPTTLFSLKDSKSTNSGAKSLFLPSPYSIKMAILNQAITLDGVDFEENGKKNEWFRYVRDIKINYFLQGNFCVNNCFVKILKPSRNRPGEVQKTVSFREYVHINTPIEIILTVQDKHQKVFLKKYLHKINYFGKRGCFFQFLEYKNQPSEANVRPFGGNFLQSGILQEYDDFGEKYAFADVNNYGGKTTVKRTKLIFTLPIFREQSSKSYTQYLVK